MTNGTSNDRLDRIELILLNLAERQERMLERQEQQEQQQQRTQEQLDREIAAMAELRTAQVTTNQHIEELAEIVSDQAVQIGTLSEQATRDREIWQNEIRRIWEYLREGRNGHSEN